MIKRLLIFLRYSVFGDVFFELVSVLFRLSAKPLRLDPEQTNYVNLGCGNVIVDGFVNVDFFLSSVRKDYGADLRHPLKIGDHTVDGIFCEHTLEHLTYEAVDQLLGECQRILKKGGIMRIIVPDLSLFIANYSCNNDDWFSQWEELFLLSLALRDTR